MARRLKFKRRTTIYLGRIHLHKDLDYYSKQKEPVNFISERLTSLVKKNEIKIEAEDEAGNKTEKKIKVKYSP